MNNILKY